MTMPGAWVGAKVDHYGDPIVPRGLYVNIGTEDNPRWGRAVTSKGVPVLMANSKGRANQQLRRYMKVYHGLEVAWGWGLLGIAPPIADMGLVKGQIHGAVKPTRRVA